MDAGRRDAGSGDAGSNDAGGSVDGGTPALRDAGTPALEWHQANLTNYTSYPECCGPTGAVSDYCMDNPAEESCEECTEYNGCMWAGYFAGLDDQQTRDWVMMHNIAAVHEDDFGAYEGKTLRLRQGELEIDVVVYDLCSDADCSGCCTENASQNGLDFLIDIERYTMERFGAGDGIVEWACLDC